MIVVRRHVTQLTRQFRLAAVCPSRYYSSTSQTTEQKTLVDNSVDEDKPVSDKPSEAGQNIATEESPSKDEDEREMVDMWNKDAIAGPEWNGPRGYEPTRYGDWSSKGRATDF